MSFQCFIIMCVQILTLQLLSAASLKGQSLQDTKISANLKNKKLVEIFQTIEKESSYVFAFPDDIKNSPKQYSFTFEEESLENVLIQIRKKANIKFRVVEQTITAAFDDHLINLAPKEVPKLKEVSGNISSFTNNESIPGVTIFEKGAPGGTISDIEGNFRIAVSDTAILVFRAIGFITEEIVVGAQSIMNVVMMEDIKALEEIVVIGYGGQKRSNLTGSISSVKAEAIENKTQMRLDQALQGMVAGVTVTRNGGAPGASPTIHIRGVGSISGTEPLWIVDGIRMEPGNHFDVDDVQSIEVLKDAASSAIYGSKAAHGVILVTTKRGSGDTKVNFKTSVGRRAPINLPKLLGSEDFVTYKKQSRLNAGQNPDPAWDNYEHDTDWVDAYYGGSGVIQSYDLSISKGDEKFNFFMSFGTDSEDGILINNTYKRYSGRINSDIKLAKWLKVGESLLISRVGENPIDNFNENYSGGMPYRSIPIMPIYDADNQFGGWGRAPVYFQGPNPVATQHQQHEYRTYNRLDGNLYLEARPLKDLLVRATVGYNYMAYFGEKFSEAFDYGSFANPIASLTYTSFDDQSVTANAVATYSKSLGRHHIKAMVGTEAYQYEANHFNVTGFGYPIDVASSLNLTTGGFNVSDRLNPYPARTLSYFGRLGYDFDEKYLFEANIRRDSSSPKFGPNNIWGNFPSFSAGWVVSREDFLSNVSMISLLKVRASSGKLGSDNIPSFIYLKTYTSQFSTYAFDHQGQNKVTGYYISKFPNEDVKWEEVNLHNVAIDLSMFENRFSFSADFYIKDTKDLLYAVPIPTSVGIATHNFNPVNPQINIGSLRNMGVDIELGYNTVIDELFSLNVSGNVSFMKNEMKSLNKDEYITGGSAGQAMGGMTRTQAGMPISSFYGYIVQQMLNSTNDVNAINTWATDGVYQEGGTGPGDFMYKDLGGIDYPNNREITADFDRTFIGNPWPKMTYALNVGLTYNKMIDLTLQFQGVQGVDVFNADKAYNRNFFGDYNTTERIFEAWTPENHTKHPRNIANDPNGNFSKSSSYFVEDGSYLKLRNAQIGFNVPSHMLKSFKMNSLRIYLNANNILTFTKYSGLDPEVAGSNTSRGIDYGLYPQVQTIAGGLELQF